MRNIEQCLHVGICDCRTLQGRMIFSGWVINVLCPIDAVDIYVDGTLCASNVPLQENGLLSDSRYSYLPQSQKAGLNSQIVLDETVSSKKSLTFRIVGKRGEEECGSFLSEVRGFKAAEEIIPVPPIGLQHYIGQKNPFFLSEGYRIYADIKKWIAPHIPDFDSIDRILDWGCGCARVTRFLIEDTQECAVFGCDIDARAIQWNTAHFDRGTFVTNTPLPPLPYPDDYFDFIYGISIFTHFDEVTQNCWLEELRRILKPGGLIGVSVLSSQFSPPGLQLAARERGFADELSLQSDDFSDFARKDYYRLTTHSRAYIEHHWSQFFVLLDFIESGINSHQDFVVMRKR